jgi:2-keto-4-pentenoate hydratase
MASSTTDPRVERGLRAQLERRRGRIAAGQEPLGWKVGFTTPAAMEKLGTSAPLVGHLMRAALLEPGAAVSLRGWVGPALEPEVAVHLRADVAPGASDAEVRAAIAGLGPAFELADIDPPPEDPETILAGNIFQRHVMLGPPEPRSSLDGLTAVVRHGDDLHEIADLEALPGPLLPTLGSVADQLGAAGERLRAGDVVIAGSLVPPMPVRPGERAEYELRPLGSLTIAFEG